MGHHVAEAERVHLRVVGAVAARAVQHVDRVVTLLEVVARVLTAELGGPAGVLAAPGHLAVDVR
eukprot:2979068-Heterocapsa_arctica.AAC.1